MSHNYPLTCCDFYKIGHRQQYPDGTELVVANFTPRSGKHSNVENKSGIIFFGLQYFIIDFLIETFDKGFFKLPKDQVVGWYKRRMDTSLGIDSIPMDHVQELHDLGYLPIEIKAVPEGTFVPVGVPCLTIHNTLPSMFWLTNYLETVLSAYMWLPCTSATTAHGYRKLLESGAAKTGSSKEFVDFQGHDFSMRGMSSLQSAVVSGAAHLLSFKGTDTIPAIDFLERYYGADCEKELVGCSVPATEHSVMCMGGEDDEIGTFRRLITKIYPKGIVSIVSDTWDFWKVLSEYSVELKTEIMARDGKVVFRPDSGNPADIICGMVSEYGNGHLPEFKGAVEVLWDIFGGTVNAAGYKELDPHVGLIYGDSITYQIAKEILERLEKKGFAASNIVFGIGSYTYQFTTRDTWGWAVKATYGVVNGEARNIFKKPKTDNGGKFSAKGLLLVNKSPEGKLQLSQEVSWENFDSDQNLLRTVFKDGVKHNFEDLATIRKRVSEQ
jgi:nicotinamide phosphoribosyltransferase